MSVSAAVLAAAACGACGCLAARCLAARESRLAQWDEALARMAAEVRRGGEDLPCLLRLSAGNALSPLREAADQMERDPRYKPDWKRELQGDALLYPEERTLLADGLRALLSPDQERQLRALTRTQEQWLRICRAAREKKEKDARLYVSLGWLAGAAAFILLC